MRRLASLTALGAILGALLLIPTDQQASTFVNPLYAPLKLKVARYIAPYDVMSNPTEKAKLDAWVAAASLAKQKILLSVEHSRTPGKEAVVPSNSAYKKAITAIKAVYGPRIESFSSWNEVNVAQKGGRTEGQPPKIASSKTGPKIVAGYFKVAKSVFKGKKIVGLDVLDGATKNLVGATKNYIKRFKAAGGSSNKYWGLHNYSDTNRYSDSIKRTKELVAAFGSGQVWLTETGGQVKSRSFSYNEARAAKAIGCTFYIAKKYKKIARVYLYQFNGAQPSAEFDGGLVGADGTTKRLGYAQVLSRKVYKCTKK